MITRPLLAETINDINDLKYPVMASPKLDGIRCLIIDGKAVTRKFKPIPNNYIRNWLENACRNGMDGEIMCPGKTFNETQSLVMSEDGEPDFKYYIFDIGPSKTFDVADKPFSSRYNFLNEFFGYEDQEIDKKADIVPHHWIHTPEELTSFEEKCLADGYEGVMVRDPNGRYKCGRSTLKEGILLKLKRFADSEAVVLGFEELMTNTNEKEKNELGLSKRSSKKSGMVGGGTLGKFNVKDIHSGVEFDIGTGDGLTKEMRIEIWSNRDRYLGKIIKYKYQPSGGKNLPRFPVWIGWRHEDDTEVKNEQR